MRLGLVQLSCLVGCSFEASVPAGAGDAAPANDGVVIDGPAGCQNHALPPSPHVDVTQWSAAFLVAPQWTCSSGGTTTIDTASGNVTNPCAGADVTNDVAQNNGGGPVMVVRLRALTVTDGHVLRIVGDKPIVFLVAGDVVIDDGALIDVGARGMTPGPGAIACVDRAAGLGASSTSGGWGGGGGGFGTAGGQGGYNTVNGGAATMSTLVPLRGGCAGAPSQGQVVFGAGGGAIAISAASTISIGATAAAGISAAGGGAPAAATGGGNGGGSGGGIFLIAPAMPSFGPAGALRAHGGAGSSGDAASTGGGTNLSGGDGHATDNTRATDTSGTAGTSQNDRGRRGGLASIVGGAALAAMPAELPNAQTQGGRGGGGGGGGTIVIATGSATPACDLPP